MSDGVPISIQRANYSKMRLVELRNRLGKLPELNNFKDLTVFGAGSYARHEASQYSDIDMFFLSTMPKKDYVELNTDSLRLFGKVIDTVLDLEYPKFSNDCEYLVILHSDEILANLGNRADDHENFFTARMLLLLESQCLYGQKIYDQVVERMIGAYFEDYPDHPQTFQPVFLINDISRYWKTLLLNYENKRRNLPVAANEEASKRKQKVRNFKLKYSRMTTCLATIAALGSYDAPIVQKQVSEIIRLTPRERLESIATRMPSSKTAVRNILSQYDKFLELTGLSTELLESHFDDKQKLVEMFAQANQYGDLMFELIKHIDASDDRKKLLRILAV